MLFAQLRCINKVGFGFYAKLVVITVKGVIYIRVGNRLAGCNLRQEIFTLEVIDIKLHVCCCLE